MPAKRLVPSDSILERWRDDGLTISEMVDKTHDDFNTSVSKGAIASALSRAGLTNRVRYDDVIPWKRIKAEHNGEYPLIMLRLLARRKHGLSLTEQQESRLDSWLERMDDEKAIVVYRYHSEQGFYYVHRKPGEKGYARP